MGKIIVNDIDVFTKPIAIQEICPKCDALERVQLLATTNEWKYHCITCDIRFNENGVVLK